MNINIRKAEEKDLEKIMDLNQKLFDFETRFTDKYNQEWTYSENGKTYFQDRIKNPNAVVLIAQVDGKIVGYALSFIKTMPYWASNPVGELENMFVDENQRGKGIGSKLISEMVGILKEKGVKRVRVGSINSNSDAIKFYESCGFEPMNLYLEKDL